MIKRIFLPVLLFIFSLSYVYAQNVYEKQWSKADSLMQKGLPQSAAAIAQKILSQAQKQGDKPNEIKAQLFLMKAKEPTTENADVLNIQELERQIVSADGVEKALWQSIAAEGYWQYFQRNRWKLYNRTAIAQPTTDDFSTWDATAFFDKIAQLYQASLANPSVLQQTPVEKYAPLILEGENTRRLRPTLYDLLAFRALDFFQNQEKDVIYPAAIFQIESPLWFENAIRFSSVQVKVKNPESLHFQALWLYQRLLKFHLNDKNPAALIDADLHRLSFIYENSVHADKDSLYLDALQQIERQYPNNPAVAEASFRIAQHLYQISEPDGRPQPLGSIATSVKTPKRDLPAIQERLKQIIAGYAGSEGAAHAQALLAVIEQQRISIQTEEVLIPNEHIRALIQYKNVDKITLTVYRIASEVGNIQHHDQKKILGLIQSQPPVLQWQQTLPGGNDLEEHATEIKIDALPQGNYVVTAGTSKDASADSHLMAATVFQVSGTAIVVNRQDASSWVYALDRKTGQPIAHTQLTFWKQEWEQARQGYRYVKVNTGQTDATGKYRFENKQNTRQQARWVTLVANKDTLQSPFSSYAYVPYGQPAEKPKQKTFFFTDRAIYRPGQTIYFKGILIKSEENGRDNRVIPNHSTTVTLYDANQEKVADIEVKSNDYGSFTATFIAPEGLLTGNMRIANATGSVDFSVEEYKRPKFYVDFDSLKTQYSLHQKVQIQGQAKAYAGQAIDGAQVRYRVVRQARFPYFWAYSRWGAPTSPEMEITQGTTQTAADGSFDISFTTLPDKTINPEALPIFTYIVYADITDINGETRSGTERIQAGYRSLQIIADIPEKALAGTLDTLSIHTQNLNGVFTPAQIHIAIHPLIFPGKVYRQRLWEMPDQFIYSEAEFHRLFPDDEYKNEGDHRTWETGKARFEKKLISTADGRIAIPDQAWGNEGWYVIELKTQDNKGQEIIEKQYTYIVVPQVKTAAQARLIAVTGTAQAEPGDQAVLWLKAAVKDAYVLETNSLLEKSVAPIRAQERFSKELTEEDRGGIAFSWTYVYNNRVYTASETIEVPWTNRDLQLEWATHRDNLKPGEQETWTLTITGNKKEQIAAEMIATLYDASLDAFRPHRWNWDKLTPYARVTGFWNTQYGFGTTPFIPVHTPKPDAIKPYEKRYDQLNTPYSDNMIRNEIYLYGKTGGIRVRGVANQAAAKEMRSDAVVEEVAVADVENDNSQSESSPEADLTTVPLRTNFQETAFFLPQLKTDENGNVNVSFTLPEALTEWKLLAFSHTKDWKTGYLEGKIKTQKDLMIMPNLPRFMRQGDAIEISAKISNLSQEMLSGTATIEVLDAMTLAPIPTAFGLKEVEVAFAAKADQSTSVSWKLAVPQERFTPIIVRMVAKAGHFSDGEENAIPVVTNRTLVTETLPLPVRGNQEKSFTLDKLTQSSSPTRTNHALTVEFTSNPAWYAVQALPYLSEYPYASAEQTFNRYYANALAAHIVAQSPKIKAIFSQWEKSDTTALISNLEKNAELKSALLAETPWVLEAKTETEQKKRIADLFNTYRLSKDLKKNINQLRDMQLPKGGFPWFKGMYHNRYITQYIITGIARLQHLQAITQNKDIEAILDKALPFLDNLIQEDYDQLVKRKVDLSKQHIGYDQIYYLYMRSFFTNRTVPTTTDKAFAYYKKQAAQYWNQFNPYMKGQIALALQRYGDVTTAQQIVASLKETAVRNEEMGMYWKAMPQGYRWYEAPIEAQSLLIETFSEVAKDAQSIDDLKTWLLKQKQTQNWGTSKATADACYALLLQGGDWLTVQPEVKIQLGHTEIRSSEESTELGTGYFKKRIEGGAIEAEMGNIRVQVNRTDDAETSWGAVYWQYFEDLDKITAAETPLSIKKQLFIERNTDRGPVLTEITDANTLKVGDKVRVRVEIRSDRDMEYVHLKDMRASTFEPVNVISQYKYQGGLGYYESTKDLSTNFFFDYLRKGTYVFEYPLFVSQKGDFSNGIATIQCMYAPEFSSHSKGIRIHVQ